MDQPPVFIIFHGSATSFPGERPISPGFNQSHGPAVLGARWPLGPRPTGSNGASLLSTARP